MLQEVEENQEEELRRKVRAKKRVRGLLIAINALLACYFVFELSMKIADFVSASGTEDSDIIALNGNSRSRSIELYDRYIAKDEDGLYRTTDAYDFGIYGDYLHLSTHATEAGKYTSFRSLYLQNVSSGISFDSSMNRSLNGAYLNGGIRLSSLEKGDYLVFDEILTEQTYASKHRAVKIRSASGIHKTIYTLPDSSGTRKKITVKSKDSSPALVLSVSACNALPKNCYDFVLIGSASATQSFRSLFSADYKILAADSLEEAVQAASLYCFVLSEREDMLVSSYLSLNDESIVGDELYGGESVIADQDKNVYIRELGGYMTGAGSCIYGDEQTCLVRPYLTDRDPGKKVAVVPESVARADIDRFIEI